MFFKYVHIIYILLIVINVSSCTSPYIGKKVNKSDSMVCSCVSLPTTCVMSDHYFDIKFDIKKSDDINNYIVNGTAAFKAAVVWDSYVRSSFDFLLIKDGVVFETISAFGGSGSFGDPISFSRKFSTKGDFDAVLIRYCIEVRDEEESSYIRNTN